MALWKLFPTNKQGSQYQVLSSALIICSLKWMWNIAEQWAKCHHAVHPEVPRTIQWKYQGQAPSIACSINVCQVYQEIKKCRYQTKKCFRYILLSIFCFLYSAVCLCNRICATLLLWFGFFILMGTASASWEILIWATTQMHTTQNTQHRCSPLQS